MPHKRADTVSDANQPQVLIHGVDYNKVLDDVDQANVHRATNGNPHGTTASDIGAAAAGHTHNPETLGAATPASVATSIAEHTSTAPHLTAGQAAAAAPVQSVAGLAGAPNATQLKAALAISTSDVSGNFDGSRITGTLPLSVLPKSAIQELKMIVNDADRFNLTLTDVQLHDSVKSSSTGLMWFLKDEANIGNSAGWEQYTAGPQGPKGDKGDKGDPGEKGDTGPAGSGSGDMLASVYDPNGDGKIATAQISGLAAVATTGSYNDLANTPDLSLKADLVAGKVPASQLPSFVDDVLEFANLAAFPATGESGKLYVAVNSANTADPSKSYRWSGTVYTEISPSPGSTSNVPEGSNLYHTPARAAAAAPVQSVAGYVGAVSAEQIRGALPAAVAGGASGLMTGADKTAVNGAAQRNANLSDLADTTIARANIGARVAMAAPVTLSANTTLDANAKYSYSAGALTLTLPAAPSNGDVVVIYNTGTLLTTVVGRNGKTIMGLAQDMTLDLANKKFVFEYLSAFGDWRLA